MTPVFPDWIAPTSAPDTRCCGDTTLGSGICSNALSKFQRDKGLKQTGTLTAPTLQALSSTSDRRGPPRTRR